ncbi:MAG: T9SS type A sorting domain-containing protein [Saprospiraceae bacterium]
MQLKLLTLVVSLLCTTCLYSQLTYSNIYRVDSNNLLRTNFSLMLVTDSCYYITGAERHIDSSTRDGILSKLDINGNVLWTKTYSDSNQTIDLRGRNIISTNQGYLATLSSNNEGIGHFLLLDTDGEVIIKRNYHSGDSTDRLLFSSIAQDNANNFYLFGSYVQSQNWKSMIIKTDSIGNEIWRKYFVVLPYNGVTINLSAGISIISINNNEFVLALVTNKNGINSWDYERGTRLIKIDSAGNILNEYQTPINNRWIAAYFVKQANKGFIFYSTEGGERRSTNVANSFNYYGYIGKIDSSFQLVWEKRYGRVRSYFGAAQEKANGEILVAGTYLTDYPPDSAQYLGWLMALDENGDSLWSRKYHRIFDRAYILHEIYDMEILPNGDILMLGTIDNNRVAAGTDFGEWGWLIRTDSFGCIVPGCQLLDNTENIKILFDNEVTVYPNPASEVVRFRFDKAIDKKTDIRVYSGLGQLVGQTALPLPNTDVQFNVSDWNSGVYHYGVYVEGRPVKQGQILVN